MLILGHLGLGLALRTKFVALALALKVVALALRIEPLTLALTVSLEDCSVVLVFKCYVLGLES